MDVDHVKGAIDRAIRPNQIFAVGGLPFALLEGAPARAVLDLASEVPDTTEHKSRGPEHRARAIASSAANRAALAAGTLALPPGPIGWLTIVPELVAIWRIQRQMVADIAGAFGVSAELTQLGIPFTQVTEEQAKSLAK